jgi:hypothetical protein
MVLNTMYDMHDDDFTDHNRPYDDEGYDEYPDPDEEPIDGVGFADPGGNSALRAETRDNPRDRPCPTCHAPNRLTRIDVLRSYQCDECADRAEGGGY